MVEYFKRTSLPQSTRDDEDSSTEKKLTFIQPVSESDVTKGQSSLSTPTTTQEVESLETTRKRSSRKSRSTPTVTQPTTELARRTSGEETISLPPPPVKTSLSSSPSTPSRIDALTREQQRELRVVKTTEQVFGQDTKPTLETLKNIPEAGFVGTKKFVKGAVQSLDPVAATEGVVTLSAGLITGEQKAKDIPGQVSEAFISDPLTFAGGVAAAIAIPELFAKVAPTKATIISQEGKISATKSTAFAEGTTLIETTDILNIQRGSQQIKAVAKGKGLVKTEIDDILLGTTKRDIEFFGKGDKPIGKATERADFNIREIEITDPITKKTSSQIRSEGTTATVGESGKIVSGKFQATKQVLPDESFVNRLISGSKKTKVKGDPTDINIKASLETPTKATSETIGFQKQQFEITTTKDVEFEIAPGIKVGKEATITKTTDLTSGAGATIKKSPFETDFLQRTTTTKQTTPKTPKSDPLLGPIRVIDGGDLLAKAPIKKTTPSPSIIGPQPQTVTVTKTLTSTKITGSQLPSSQILDVLPAQPTTAFFPTAITTSSAKGITTKPRTETPSQSIEQALSVGPSVTDLSRTFKPPKTTTPPEQTAIVTPLVIPDIAPSPQKTRTKSKSSSTEKITEPVIDIVQELTEDTITKQKGRGATRQLLKQQVLGSTPQTAAQRVGTFGQAPVIPTLVPPAKVPIKLKSQDIFSVVIGKKENVVFKELSAGSLSEAASIGFKETKKGAAASFQVFKGGEAIDIGLIPGFTKSKKDKTRIVQKKETRISSLGELEEITELGIATSKKRKKSSKKKKKDSFDFSLGGLL